MISVIICSRGPEFRKAVTENIEATIGVPHEIVAIDNSENKYGICAAYNEGASRSKYDILCFAHEDIEFKTNEWGKIVERILVDNSIGVVGVTGGKWLPKAPGTWWSCGTRYLTSNVIDYNSREGYSRHTYSNPENKPLVDVAAVDGLWICTRREVWKKYPFDSKTFPGFHFYDVDFCANIFHQYRICVTVEIVVAHFSLGSYNNSWFTYADIFYQKHAGQLPLGNPGTSAQKARKYDYDAHRIFLLELIDRKLPAKMGYKYLVICVTAKPLSREALWLIWYYIKYIWRSRVQYKKSAAL